MRALLFLTALIFPVIPHAQGAEWTAPKLAGAMAALVEDGDSTARVKMTSEVSAVLQVRIKSRRSAGETLTNYEILWPKERKGEAFVLREGGKGLAKAADGSASELAASDLSKPVFGTALAYADVLENFFRWDNQALLGTEAVGKTDCLVLESRPGVTDASIYGRVKSWIDPRRMVAMRVEKYDRSGSLARRIETTQVAKDDTGKNVPSAMSVQSGDKTTEIDGANIRHDVQHADADFAL